MDAMTNNDIKDNNAYGSGGKPIGKWKLKSVKYSSIYELLKPIKFNNNSSLDSLQRSNMAWSLVSFLNKELPNRKIFKLVVEFIQSNNKSSKSISIQSIEKHFSQINNKIDRDLIIKMCTEGYLSKSYHKVEITKKGFDLIKKIKNK
jgi:predicted transcriptional regulator